MASFTDTDEVGVYTVVTARGETRVAVNLMNARGVGPDAAAAARPSWRARGPSRRRCRSQRELWPYFVVLALLVFAIEGSSTGAGRPAGASACPARLGDRWALGLRCALVVVLLLVSLAGRRSRAGWTAST